MYVRLAFAVAAHLEPEILVVDEVLAVGDASFQKKCLGKMEDVAEREGRTILLVSHQMAPIQKLCPKSILLQSGLIRFTGSTGLAVQAYLEPADKDQQDLALSAATRKGNGKLRAVSIDLLNSKSINIDSAVSGDDLVIEIQYKAMDEEVTDLSRVVCSIQVHDRLGDPLLLTHNRMTAQPFKGKRRKGCFRVRIPRLPLPAGDYLIGFSFIRDSEYLDGASQAKKLRVEAGDYFGTGEIPPPSHCKFIVDTDWSERGSV